MPRPTDHTHPHDSTDNADNARIAEAKVQNKKYAKSSRSPKPNAYNAKRTREILQIRGARPRAGRRSRRVKTARRCAAVSARLQPSGRVLRGRAARSSHQSKGEEKAGTKHKRPFCWQVGSSPVERRGGAMRGGVEWRPVETLGSVASVWREPRTHRRVHAESATRGNSKCARSAARRAGERAGSATSASRIRRASPPRHPPAVARTSQASRPSASHRGGNLVRKPSSHRLSASWERQISPQWFTGPAGPTPSATVIKLLESGARGISSAQLPAVPAVGATGEAGTRLDAARRPRGLPAAALLLAPLLITPQASAAAAARPRFQVSASIHPASFDVA